MKISTLTELLDAKIICGEENIGKHVYSACGSDMMSDVLAYVKDQAVLLTGLVNTQVVRTAMMMDMVCIVFVRNKMPTEEMIELARADLENAKATIPLVEFDSRLGYEPSMEYMCDRAHIEWKIGVSEELINDELPRYYE